MSETTSSIHLAVALDGAGWHPAAWRESDARPRELFEAQYWIDLVRLAESAAIDFVTFEDALQLQSDDHFASDQRTDRVRGRLDAVLLAARVAPTTTRVGIVASANATHTEPFHLSKAIATVDYVSHGRAGIRVQLSVREDTARHFGRRSVPLVSRETLTDPSAAGFIADQFDEVADYVEVLRRLWDSWEDDAVIRDVVTGRYIDREKLHYVDFAGRWFSVKGPSITPRPPQGQPPVVVLAHSAVGYRLVARSADVGLVTPQNAEDAVNLVAAIRREQESAGRGGETVHVFGELVVFLDDSREVAVARRRRLDDLAGTPVTSDALVFAGTASELADLLDAWSGAGVTGFRLRPAALPHDLEQIAGSLVPELRDRGLFRQEYAPEGETLRSRLGLGRAINRYERSELSSVRS